MNLPNSITILRIALAVVLAPLILAGGALPRLAAFVLFLVAALSDLWDGYLARSRKMVTDLGKLLDPIADKLLLAATLLPLYALSLRGDAAEFPWFGGVLPLWIVLVIFAREIFITLFRSYAARRGVVIAAGRSGKYKAVFQNLFVGSAILWYALHALEARHGWGGGWESWIPIHRAFSITALSVAVLLTLYSMGEYLLRYRRLVPGAA
ncbi:MAG: CDP-diacylglycerol--glycerol-3-phosphate 3-phosphatidyltransferase [Longimicrobiaceae bacterium]